MAYSSTKSLAEAFFINKGPTLGLFTWLDFRRYMATKDIDQLSHADNSETNNSEPNNSELNDINDAVAFLTQWQAGRTPKHLGALFSLRLFTLVAGVLGIMAMAGVLQYNPNGVINLWIPLALFALIPCLLTMLSAVFFWLQPRQSHAASHPFLQLLMQRFNLHEFSPDRPLVFNWLTWKLQSAALIFALCALLSFVVFATFQDFQFGWSSTLIQNNATMSHMMAVITAPWQWMLSSDLSVLVSQSRYSAGAVSLESASVMGAGWWPHLVMAMLVYGCLPRLVLLLVMRHRLCQRLKTSVQRSVEIEQLILVFQHQATKNGLTDKQVQSRNEDVDAAGKACVSPPKIDASADMPCSDQIDITCVSWQNAGSELEPIHNLGSGDWQADEAWINELEPPKEQDSLAVLVDILQTPTGELGDCIELIQARGVAVHLLVVSPIVIKDTAEREVENQREMLQLKSWKHFAKAQGVALVRYDSMPVHEYRGDAK